MMSVQNLFFLLLTLSSVEILRGQERDHEDGFFLRLSTGPGFAKTRLNSNNAAMKLSGETADLNFAIGGIISPNLALHATLYGWLVQDPDVEVSGISGKGSGDLDLNAFGVGLTYYFMPVNIYISGSGGLGKLSADGEENVGETKEGPVFDMTVGKEWWVGSSWGLGLAGAIVYHSLPEKNADGSWSGLSFAVRFSATLN